MSLCNIKRADPTVFQRWLHVRCGISRAHLTYTHVTRGIRVQSARIYVDKSMRRSIDHVKA